MKAIIVDDNDIARTTLSYLAKQVNRNCSFLNKHSKGFIDHQLERPILNLTLFV